MRTKFVYPPLQSRYRTFSFPKKYLFFCDSLLAVMGEVEDDGFCKL